MKRDERRANVKEGIDIYVKAVTDELAEICEKDAAKDAKKASRV